MVWLRLFFQPFLSFFFFFLSKYRGANRAPEAIPSKRLASELLSSILFRCRAAIERCVLSYLFLSCLVCSSGKYVYSCARFCCGSSFVQGSLSSETEMGGWMGQREQIRLLLPRLFLMCLNFFYFLISSYWGLESGGGFSG